MSSLVNLQGGGRNFGLHIRTQLKCWVHPRGWQWCQCDLTVPQWVRVGTFLLRACTHACSARLGLHRSFGRTCTPCSKAEFILERKCFLSLCRMRISGFWGQERLTDRSISKRYLKSDITTWVEKSSTSRAIHARDTGFYWSSENALHERFIASSGVGVWMKMLQFIAKR